MTPLLCFLLEPFHNFEGLSNNPIEEFLDRRHVMNSCDELAAGDNALIDIFQAFGCLWSETCSGTDSVLGTGAYSL